MTPAAQPVKRFSSGKNCSGTWSAVLPAITLLEKQCKTSSSRIKLLNGESRNPQERSSEPPSSSSHQHLSVSRSRFRTVFYPAPGVLEQQTPAAARRKRGAYTGPCLSRSLGLCVLGRGSAALLPGVQKATLEGRNGVSGTQAACLPTPQTLNHQDGGYVRKLSQVEEGPAV